ncbi:MAG: hypothetical protein ABI566_00515 [Pseudolysinimonas sp.]
MSIKGRPWADVRNDLYGSPYMVWHDGPAFSGLRDAWRTEPEALLEQLIVGMGEGDALAAESFAELEPAPTGDTLTRVVDMLEQHLPTSPPGAQVQIALTLLRLTADQSWARHIGDVLDAPLHWSTRIDAAIALRRVDPSPDLTAVLVRGVQADDYLVRYHSAGTLRRWAGLGDIEEDDALFTELVKDADPAAWATVATALQGLHRSL